MFPLKTENLYLIYILTISTIIIYGHHVSF